MKARPIIAMFMLVCLMLACNMPSAAPDGGNPPASNETVIPPETLEPAAATDTPAPAPETATVTPTPTPSAPAVTPIQDPVNCRFSTDKTYESVGAGLGVGVSAPVLGKSPDGSWWQIQNPGGPEKCWVSASVTTASGDFSQVPVVTPPLAFVTNLTLQVKPESVNLGPGCPGPAPHFSLKGMIYVNGPAEVKWRFETEKDGALPYHTVSFTMYGFKEVTYDYAPSDWKKGSYWVRLVVTSPNSMVAEATYQIKCS